MCRSVRGGAAGGYIEQQSLALCMLQDIRHSYRWYSIPAVTDMHRLSMEIEQIYGVYEQEADCVADAVMQMIEPDGIHLYGLFFNSPSRVPQDMITHEST